MKRLEIEDQGKIHEAWVVFDDGAQGQRLWLHVDGQTNVIELQATRRRGRASLSAATESSGLITAPMPGKVTKLAVAIGEQIASGQLVVVMEAMKMEYSLKAKQSGEVRAIHCAVGEQVSLGQKLVEIAVPQPRTPAPDPASNKQD